MIGARKLEKFLKEAEKHEAKVVLIGDTKQFQSIEQGKIFADLQEHAGVSKAEVVDQAAGNAARAGDRQGH